MLINPEKLRHCLTSVIDWFEMQRVLLYSNMATVLKLIKYRKGQELVLISLFIVI